MTFKKINLSPKRAISIFGAVAILATSIPVGSWLTKINAATEGTIIDFQDKNSANIVENNDSFSIAGQDSEDKYYFYAKNATTETKDLLIDNINLVEGKKYTIDLDVYTMRLSKESSGALFGLKVGNGDNIVLDVAPSNDLFYEEGWANYHSEFTATNSDNDIIFSLYNYSKVIIDNFVIIDENGVETAIDVKTACENTNLKEHFAYSTLMDISKDEPDVINGYIKASIPTSSTITDNRFIDVAFGEVLASDTYTMEIDLKFESLSTCENSMCIAVFGEQESSKSENFKWYFNTKDAVLKKYVTYSYKFDKQVLTANNTFFRFHVYQGVTVSIDNVKLINSKGEEVLYMNFDKKADFATVEGFEQFGYEGKTEPNITGKSLEIKVAGESDSNNASAEYIQIDFPTEIPAGEYIVTFDTFLKERLDGAFSTNIFALQYVYKEKPTGVYNYNNNCFIKPTLYSSEALQRVEITISPVSEITGIQIHLYQGNTMFFDNIIFASKDDSVNFKYDFETSETTPTLTGNATSYNIDEHDTTPPVVVPVLDDPHILIDSSKYGSSDGYVYIPLSDNNSVIDTSTQKGAILTTYKSTSYTLNLDVKVNYSGTDVVAEAVLGNIDGSGNFTPIYDKPFNLTLSSNNILTATFSTGAGPANISRYNNKQWNYLRIKLNNFGSGDSSTKLQIFSMEIVDNKSNTFFTLKDMVDESTVPVFEEDYDYCSYVVPTPPVPEKVVNESGINIAFLRGRAGANGGSIKLGGTNSPLTLENDKTYRLTFDYYQANPTTIGVFDLLEVNADKSVIGLESEPLIIKKNDSNGWTNVSFIFTTGTVASSTEDWLNIKINSNGWVYFDNFKLDAWEADTNTAFDVIDFATANDDIYPSDTQINTDQNADCKFGWSSDHGGTFKIENNIKYTVENSNHMYKFKGIKLKSFTSYRVSVDFYTDKAFTETALAFGYIPENLGMEKVSQPQIYVNNVTEKGWHTISFNITTGEVLPNREYIKIHFYDISEESTEPRIMYLDNMTFTELVKVDISPSDESLGTVSKTMEFEPGGDAKAVAHPYEGVTFEGWYEYGDLVSTDRIYRLSNVTQSHKLIAKFSGTATKPSKLIQSFEDFDTGDIGYEWYEIVNDSSIAFDGDQVLHIKPDKIEDDIDASIFFPIVSNVEDQLKDDYYYDIYVWVKPVSTPDSLTYFQVVHTLEYDLADLVERKDVAGSGLQQNITPEGTHSVETKDGWYKYKIGTVTKLFAMAKDNQYTTYNGFGFQVCKFHAGRGEGASIDDFYVDCVEVVERVPEFDKMLFSEKLFNEVTNSDFEEEVTEENWAPLTPGVTIERVTDKQFDWQGEYQLKFDAAVSNGQEYVRIIPIAKQNKNYTFAAWTRLSEGSDITVGFYRNGKYEPFTNIMNGENGLLPLVADGKWNRVGFTFSSEDNEEGYIVIKGTKGTLELDLVELFFAMRGYETDPNEYSNVVAPLDIVDPIAFPDIVRTEVTYIENEPEEEPEVEEEKKTKKYRVVKRRKGGTSIWLWVGIGAGAVVLVAATVLFIILFKKRRNAKKGAV